ncbi:MAG: SCO family protein [Planctomycetales bacterium]|nr:SCO family protein [bacterium]UNM07240.1 MAG: SCO family protein [Planctomycetales bacterium]
MFIENSYRRAGQAVILAMAAGLALAAPVRAQINDKVPDEVQNIEIVEHLDEHIPLDLKFRDENGKEVMLADYFNEEKPVLVNMVYLNCPMLCTLVVNGTFDALSQAEMGENQYNMLTISFVDGETPDMARAKMDNYIGRYGMPAGAAEWHILTGDDESITPLCQAIGFGYEYIEERNEYSHQAAAFVLTPDGRMARYLYGVAFKPATLKYSIIEASEGRIGTTVDKVFLYCFHYDAEAGSYAAQAWNISRVFLTLFAMAFLVFLGGYWAAERIKRKPRNNGPVEGTS